MTKIGSKLVEMKHAIQLMCSVIRSTGCPKENGPLHISPHLIPYKIYMKGFRVETIRGLKNMRHHNKVFSKSTILQELIIFLLIGQTPGRAHLNFPIVSRCSLSRYLSKRSFDLDNDISYRMTRNRRK